MPGNRKLKSTPNGFIELPALRDPKSGKELLPKEKTRLGHNYLTYLEIYAKRVKKPVRQLLPWRGDYKRELGDKAD